MKLRPQFNLRFRDAEQFELAMDEAGREKISMNEWVLLRLEEVSIVLRGQRVTAAKMEEENGGSGGNSRETENNSGVDERGIGGGVKEPDAGAVRPGGVRAVASGGCGAAFGAGKRPENTGAAKNAGTEAVNAEIATGGSAGVAAAGISPEGKRGVQKGVAGDHGKLLRGDAVSVVIERARPKNPIETDAVGGTGCKVTVSRAMAGRPAHAGNCQCFTCKLPKGEK